MCGLGTMCGMSVGCKRMCCGAGVMWCSAGERGGKERKRERGKKGRGKRRKREGKRGEKRERLNYIIKMKKE